MITHVGYKYWTVKMMTVLLDPLLFVLIKSDLKLYSDLYILTSYVHTFLILSHTCFPLD